MTFALLVVADRRAFLCGGWSAQETGTARRQTFSPHAQEETATSTYRFIRRLLLVPDHMRQRLHSERFTRIRVDYARSPFWVGEDLLARPVRVLESRSVNVDDPLAVATAAAQCNPLTNSSGKVAEVRMVAVASNVHLFLGGMQHHDRDAVSGYEGGNVGLVDIGDRVVYAVTSREPMHDLQRKRDMA